jgi:osmotically-inducible protein OsmY
MKRPFQRLAKRGRWAVALAGAFALSSTAPAQTSPYHPLKSDRAGPQASRPWPTSMTEQAARDIEVKVQLAWLSKQVTFPYRLEARVVGSTLEVHGHVPSEGSRELALQIARQESGLRVADQLQVTRGLKVAPTTKPLHLVANEANAALGQALPSCARNITVNVWMQGQVVLQGRVSTLEEKLTASLCLRRVAGCNCVINQLDVAPATGQRPSPAPETQTTVQLSEVVLLRPESLQGQTVKQAAGAGRQESVTGESTATHTSSVSGTTILPTRRREPAARSPNVAPQAGSFAVARQEPTQAAPEARAIAEQPRNPSNFYHTKWRKMEELNAWRPGQVQAESPHVEPAPTLSPAPKRTLPDAGVIQVAGAQAASPTKRPLAPLRALLSGEDPKKQVPSSKDAYETSGVIMFETETPRPSAGAEPAKASAGTAATNPERRLQEKIARACGKSATDVEVKLLSEKNLHLCVKAQSAAEGNVLWDKISHMPELDAFEVALDVPVDR